MAALSLAGVATWWAIVGPHMVLSFGSGMIGPNASAGAVGLYPRLAGTASSWVGLAQMGMGAHGHGDRRGADDDRQPLHRHAAGGRPAAVRDRDRAGARLLRSRRSRDDLDRREHAALDHRPHVGELLAAVAPITTGRPIGWPACSMRCCID